jgi:hypothetical protein
MIATKKTLNALGGVMNDSVGSKCSDFSRKQLEKFGWTEYVTLYYIVVLSYEILPTLNNNLYYRGKGLGKNEDGISKHVKVRKREEAVGVVK